MSHLIARILLTVLIFPATVLFYVVAFIFVERLMISADEEAIVFTAIPSSAFMIVYWLLLWRRSVNWTSRRIAQTLWSLGGAALAGALIGLAINFVLPQEGWLSAFLGVACGSVIWIISTIFLWRETRDERGARVGRGGQEAIVCPVCGYNLTGLTSTRCPECGKQFTLDELLASQPHRAPAELEKA